MILLTSIVNAATIQGTIYDLSLEKRIDSIIEINTIPKQIIVSKTGDYTFYVSNGNYSIHAYTKYGETKENITITNDGNYTIDLLLDESTEIPSKLTNNTEENIEVSTATNNSGNEFNIYTIIEIILLIIVIIIGLIYISRKIQQKVELKIKQIERTAKRQEKKLTEEKLKSIRRQKNSIKKSKTKLTENKSDNNPYINKIGNKILTSKNIHENNNEKETVTKNIDQSYEDKIFEIIQTEKRITQKELRKNIPLSEAKISLVITELESLGKIRKIKQGRGNIIIFVKE